jgi:Fic family protein
MSLFDSLGFEWNRSRLPEHVATHTVKRVVFRLHRMLPEFVWDASVLEGNPITYPEVQTLMDGITVGGRKVSDQAQILNLIKATQGLLSMVKRGEFEMSKAVFQQLHRLVAFEEALEWGVFRGEGEHTDYTPHVGLGAQGQYRPLATEPGAPALHRVFDAGVQSLAEACPPFERGLAFFLFGALQQFFFDGNKRTSRLMMNGILMSHGIDAISVPAARAEEFNERMVEFYLSKDATDMMAFLVSCHPDFAA